MEDYRNLKESKPEEKPQESSRGSSRAITYLTTGLVLATWMILGLGYGLYHLHQENHEAFQDLNDQLSEMQDNLPLFANRIDDQQKVLDFLVTDGKVLQERLGVTENELAQARILADNLREEQDRTANNLSEQIVTKASLTDLEDLKSESDGRFEQVDAQVSEVKQGVDRNLHDLQSTWQELSGLGVKVTEQGQLVATNAEGIKALERNGERDYVQFVAVRDEPFRVGDLSVELRDTNREKSRAKLRLYFDDKRIVRSRVATNQPLVLYVGQQRVPYEVVINDVEKGKISGYVSLPVGIASTNQVAALHPAR